MEWEGDGGPQLLDEIGDLASHTWIHFLIPELKDCSYLQQDHGWMMLTPLDHAQAHL